MKISQWIVLLFLILFCASGFTTKNKTPFKVKETKNGIELLENGRPVFNYQRKPKSLTGEYICNNYIHPLYSIDGDTLTEEFPSDHLFHRGIFWAWHQLYIGNKSVGDGWIMKDISLDVYQLRTKISDSTAQISADVNWKSSIWENGRPFVHEHTNILVHQLKAGVRTIDFEISLKALVPGVSIGGSDDEKGYGGFCARIKLPKNLVFNSEKGPVIPQNLSLEAGPWMNFTGSFISGKRKSGITMICLPETPNYPAPWILRKETSMQNIVFPGKQRIELPVNNVTVLKYRLIVNN